MQLNKLSAQRFVEVPLIVIPNLFRDRLIFQRPEGAKNETIDPVSPFFCSRLLVSNANSRIRSFSVFTAFSVQRVLDFKRAVVLRSKMLKRVHDRCRRFQNDVCYHSRHDFLEVPLFVIPNLVRDLGFGKPSLGV